MKSPIVLFNVTWMKSYQGVTSSDQPHGGGSWIEKSGAGGEIANFLPYRNKYYGYVQPSGTRINIDRLGASTGDEFVNGVTLVWTAPDPAGGTAVVGWYKNATVFREAIQDANLRNRKYKSEYLPHNCVADVAHCHLLELDERIFRIPRGKGGFGQANVWFGESNPKLLKDLRQYIATGRLPKNRKAFSVRHKGGFRQLDPFKRQKIETSAIRTVKKYYGALDYRVTSVETENVGWDLEVSGQNRVLKLEVKGVSGSHIAVELTPNEYQAMTSHEEEYRLCVVTQALKRPNLSVFAFAGEQSKWIDGKGRALIVQERKSARLYI